MGGMRWKRILGFVPLSAVLVARLFSPVYAQVSIEAPPGVVTEERWVGPVSVGLPRLSGSTDERVRLAQILGDTITPGYLLRSTSWFLPADTSAGLSSWGLIEPRLRLVNNSGLPFSINEGALWAGRGRNAELSVGVFARGSRWTAILMPHLLTQQNADFQTFAYPDTLVPERSSFASPWYQPGESIDRPSRFGDEPMRGFSLGQSSVTVDLGAAAVGLATENLWWGPGIRNALVMSNNAPGFPHLFVRTPGQVQTRLGAVEARWIVGALASSGYFDKDWDGARRSISGLAVTLTPAAEPNLTLGATRVVYAPTRKSLDWLFDWFNVFRDVGRPAAAFAALPEEEVVEGDDDEEKDPYRLLGPDQLFSLFGRWVFPEAGFEAYGEWGRTERPSSLRDLLVSPHHTQGYTVGLQWADRREDGGVVRLQAEASNLELSSTYRQRPTLGWYTSASVPHGYTNRGRVIGAAIGPGASSQWLAMDHFTSGTQLGLFAGRIRWDNGAFYRRSSTPTYHGHDVSVFGGIRGALNVGPVNVAAEFQTETRINYLFQHIPISQANIQSVDIRNNTLRISLGSATSF